MPVQDLQQLHALVAQMHADAAGLAVDYGAFVEQLKVKTDAPTAAALVHLEQMHAQTVGVTAAADRSIAAAQVFMQQCGTLHQQACGVSRLEEQVVRFKRLLSQLEPLVTKAVKSASAAP